VRRTATARPGLRHFSAVFTRHPGVWLWLLPLFFLGFFFFYPLSAVFRMAGDWAISQGWSVDVWEQVAHPLLFTVWQALLSTVLTLALGLPSAYVLARYAFPGKTALQVLTTLPFILPTIVVAVAFSALLGPRGVVNVLLMQLFGLANPPLQVMNTLGLILLAHVFYNTTVVIRIVGSAWSQLDVRLEQAGRVLGASPWKVAREVTLPLLRPSILAASLLVFLFDFTSFGVILLLGGPHFATLEVEIYTQALQMLNLPLAGLLSAIQLLCTLLLTVVYARLGDKQPIPLMPRLQGEGTRPPQGWRQKLLVVSMSAILLALLVSPLAALALRSVTRLDANRGERGLVSQGLTLDYYRQLFINQQDSIFYVPPVQAAQNSLGYALATTGLSLSLGFLAVYAMKFQPSRWMDALFMLPLGASAVTLGLGFILVFNRPPLDVRSIPWLVPVAHSLVALPFVVRTLQPVLQSIPGSLRQAAAVLGASPWRVWLEVDLPVMLRAVLVSAILSFTISLGEFGATSFLARPEYPTLPIAIYRFLSLPGALNYGQALAMATVLMVVCGISILVMDKMSG
jgi:thiamine transport system permease protein